MYVISSLEFVTYEQDHCDLKIRSRDYRSLSRRGHNYIILYMKRADNIVMLALSRRHEGCSKLNAC